MKRFKTEMMQYGHRQRPVEEIVEDAMYEKDISVVKSYLIYLQRHASITQDDVLQKVCDDFMVANGMLPSKSTPASDFNMPPVHQEGPTPQQQAQKRMQQYLQSQESFADRVKKIIEKAATKNEEIIETRARGHAGTYTYRINSEVFCNAMDEMVSTYSNKLEEFLGGSLDCKEVTKVCLFIGSVIRMNVINDVHLQTVDILFAFEDYYKNLQTVKVKLSVKNISDDQNVVLGFFEGLLKKHADLNNRK